VILSLDSSVYKGSDRFLRVFIAHPLDPDLLVGSMDAFGYHQLQIAGFKTRAHTCLLAKNNRGDAMESCFVIQPFDGGRYDKLFTDVYAPAIEAAGYSPYRVDKDASVAVPIDSIEAGIKSAVVCLADITEDNPNVWYELGYAFAANRPVVMICAENRQGKKYPFDIAHRSILIYKPDSLSDFEQLKKRITERMKAIVTREETIQMMSESEPISPVGGLSQPEVLILAILGGAVSHDFPVSSWSVKNDAERAGITGVGFNLGVRRLLNKSFIQENQELDEQTGESYRCIQLLDFGWAWIEANESRFVIHRGSSDGALDLGTI
jgi:nucleoside 2-deoxyribosyltransferase